MQRAIAAAHPGAAAIATEDIAHYLEIATGLTDKTPEGYLAAVAADTDPPPADIAAVLDVISSHDAQVLLFNPQTDTSVTRRIVDAANTAGVPVVEVRETLPAGGDFLSWQRHTVEKLGTALQVSGLSHAVNAPVVQLSAASLKLGDRSALGRSGPDRSTPGSSSRCSGPTARARRRC